MALTTRRIGALGIAAVLAGAFLSSPAARAQQAESFVASASGNALDLGLFGQKFTIGYSTATADSSKNASAEGAGIFEPLAEPTHAKASASGGQVDTRPDACGAALPAPLSDVVDLGLACGTATADSNAPSAKATGKVAKLNLAANTVLDQLPVTEPVEQALEGILGNLPEELSPVTDTVGSVVEGLLHTQTLASTVGGSTSTVTTSASAVTAVGHAAGAQIDILPAAGLGGGAIATIYVGEAKATASYDRAAGTSTASVDPALVRVVLRLPLTGEPVEIKVPVGQTITILENTPLESTITAADGKVTNNPDGSVKAVADAVKLELLKGLEGGISLGLAHAEAAAAGAPEIKVQPQAAVEAPRELPRTGGTMPALPVLGAGLMALALTGRRFLLARD